MVSRIVITAVWVFITVVASADVYVSWICRSSVLEWQANPVAALLFSWSGPAGILLYRAGWLVYARIMSGVKSHLSWLVTPVWGLGHLYLLITLVQLYPALAVLAARPEAGPNTGDVVELGGLKSRVPADWVEERPDDAQDYKQYRLEPFGNSVDSARLSVRFLRNGNDGSAADYVRRWKGMFLPPEGRTMQEAAQVRQMTVNGVAVTYVDIRGDYRGIPGDAATPRQNSRLLGAYLDTPNGAYIVRLMGPDDTVRFYREGFENWVKAFK
jgi:hypothetical protein